MKITSIFRDNRDAITKSMSRYQIRKIARLIISYSVFIGSTSLLAYECEVIYNVKGTTPLAESQTLAEFDWLAFSKGKISALGKGDVDERFKNCKKQDGNQQFLIPGLIDAHGHVSSLGNELLRVQLRGITSEKLAAKEVASFAKRNPNTKWILGRGWNQVLWPTKSFPTRQSLDKLNIDRPIVLQRVDGHAAWLNSSALKAAGITDNTPDPQGGKIERDKKGVATGVLIDNAIGLIDKKIPDLDNDELDHAFEKAFDHLLSLGITSVHDAGVSQADLDTYIKRHKSNRLPLRIYGMLSGTSQHLDSWLAKGPFTKEDDFLSIRSVKLYSDGALGSRGAALLKPYSDDPHNDGLLLTEPKKLDALIHRIIASGFQVNVHAIGDKGNRIVLDSFEKAHAKPQNKKLRHRIEHAQVVSPADIPRFKKLDIIASMQPTHATSDKNMAGDRIGQERLKGAYAWQKFLKQGVIIASGSDFPVEYANPFFGLHAAMTRQDQNDEPKGGWLADEKMTATQALRSFTIDAAYAGHQEKTIGSLEKGKWADFILIDQDVINSNAKNLWKTRVLETWIAGKRMYKRVQ